jgi:prepilin-type N-terminal cleavage/methylation domain-containing protein
MKGCLARNKLGGFTLVELLLVVSILSLLLSVLVPSLSHAKQAGKRTLCLNNLHQIGIAMAAYFGQHADAFPWLANWEYANNCRTNQSWFYGGRYPPVQVDPLKVAPELRFLPEQRPFNGHLYPYATGAQANLKVYCCPNEDGIRWVGYDNAGGSHDARSGYLITGTSYTANWWWMGFSGVPSHRQENELG